jgi:cbb3-type cytochrome oxidase subunit 1
MSPTVIGFIKTSLLSLAVGVVLGVLIALHVLKPDQPQLLTSAHSHVNLLGGVMMLIFGVGYHILPRFSGRPLWNEKMADVQLWVNIIGLAGMVIAFIAAAYSKSDLLRYAVAPFGALYGLGALLFVINMWKTISGALPAPSPLKVPGKPE